MQKITKKIDLNSRCIAFMTAAFASGVGLCI